MNETSLSLLDRLRATPDAAAWNRLVEAYSPLIRGWLYRQAWLPEADADDVVQEVLAVVIRKVPGFLREPRVGAFRRWLRSITVNCLRDHFRARRGRPLATGDSDVQAVLDQLEDPHSGLSRLWDQEHDQHLTRYLLDLIKPNFTPATWHAFYRVAIDGEPAQQVAADLGLTVNAVFIAKSRVLAKLREEGRGLID